MDIHRIITIVRNLKEDVPTNNTGSNGSKAGFSAAATGSVTGYDKLLHEPLLDQDYQTPYGLNYRLSNVFPAAKLDETDIEIHNIFVSIKLTLNLTLLIRKNFMSKE